MERTPQYMCEMFDPSDSSWTEMDSLQFRGDDNTDIAEVMVIRPSAATHANNMTQRRVLLEFEKIGSDSLVVTAPWHGGVAPPGDYMLFLSDSTGVPSVAPFLRLQEGDYVVADGDTTEWAGTVRPQASYTVEAGGTLIVRPGTKVYAAAEDPAGNDLDVKIAVEGQMLAKGTASSRILFASDSKDSMPGEWLGIQFLDNNTDTRASDLSYCDFRYPTIAVQVDSIACTLFQPTFEGSEEADIYADRDFHIEEGTEWDLKGPVRVVISDDVGYGGSGGGDETALVEGLVRGALRTSGPDSVLFLSEDEDSINGDDWFGFVFSGSSVADISTARIGYAVAPLSFWDADTARVRDTKIHAYSSDGILVATNGVEIEDCTIVRGESLDEDVETTGVHVVSKSADISGCLIGGQSDYGIWGDFSQSYCTSSPGPAPAETLRIVDCRLRALLETPEDAGILGGTGIYLTWICHEMRAEVSGDTLNTWRGGPSDLEGVGIVLNRCSNTDVACCVVKDGKTGVFFRRDGTKLASGEEAVWLRQNEIRGHTNTGLLAKAGVDSLVLDAGSISVAGANVFQLGSLPAPQPQPTFVALISVTTSDTLLAGDQTWEDDTAGVYTEVDSVLAHVDAGWGEIDVPDLLTSEDLCEGTSAGALLQAGVVEDDRDRAAQRVLVDDLPIRFELHAGAPNPTGGPTSIRFGVPAGDPVAVTIEIFDVTGRRVWRRGEPAVPPGRHARTWAGRDDAGNEVSSGVYFVRLRAADFVATRKVVVTR